MDNDMFGGADQDQGYTNGFMASWISPNLASYQDDPCIPHVVRSLNRYLAWLQPANFEEQNMTIGVGQMMYTPTDHSRRDLIKDDRPYAGALMMGLGYNARQGGRLSTSQLRFGIIGPASLAGKAHESVHKVIGGDRFRGWDNQLHNEPVVQLLHERRRRLAEAGYTSGPWRWDAIGHVGGSLGNFATYANTGLEMRFGYLLPDDLGTAPLRPAGDNTSPLKLGGAYSGWAGHAFIAVDSRWVLYDITLDGNTFRSSHSVDKKSLVADIGYGVAITHGPWRLAFTRYHRTREFHGQDESPVYGTFTIGRRL